MFNVGDKVVVTGALPMEPYSNGDIGVVTMISFTGSPYVKFDHIAEDRLVLKGEIDLVEQEQEFEPLVDGTSIRITQGFSSQSAHFYEGEVYKVSRANSTEIGLKRATEVKTWYATAKIFAGHEGVGWERVPEEPDTVPEEPDTVAEPSAVEHPAHYGGGDNPYEAIKVIEAWGLGFRLGNTVKYIAREGKKDAAKELEDLKKAEWFLHREIVKREVAAKNAGN